MSCRYFDIGWSDLTFEAQQSIINSVKESLMEGYETMGTGAMLTQWHVEPKTWQEAYCRDNSVDYKMWSDLDEKSAEFQAIDWKQTLDEYAEAQAEEKCQKSIRHLEFEVEL